MSKYPYRLMLILLLFLSHTVIASAGTVGGTLSGMKAGTYLILKNNNANALIRINNGVFQFSKGITKGSSYKVTVAKQPTFQICQVSNGSGIMTTKINNVIVNCVPNQQKVGGQIKTLIGEIQLSLNKGPVLKKTGSGGFTFTNLVDQGKPYEVKIIASPHNQTCTLSNSSGFMGTVDVTSVLVNCSTRNYAISGSILGLPIQSAMGLKLMNNNTNEISIANGGIKANGTSFAFSKRIAYGGSYDVQVSQNPAGLVCNVVNNMGTNLKTNKSNVVTVCSPKIYALGGTITGLNAEGLILKNGNYYVLPPSGTTSFNFFPIAHGGSFNITVHSQPTGLECSIENGTNNNVQTTPTNIKVACAVPPIRAKCWGLNDNGQLGNGSINNSNVPIYASNLNGVNTISGAMRHQCAIVNSGVVRCWGANDYGELGNGTIGITSSTPIDANINGTIAIAAGYQHVCAIVNSGAVYCWGANYLGTLGNGTKQDSPLPIQVNELSDAKAITAGNGHTCTLLNSGTVRCWGSNDGGQLGDGTFNSDFTPVQVLELNNVIAIAAGLEHTCALLNAGTVKCWGGRFSNYPVEISDLNNVTAIAAGKFHTCALLSSGNVKCWGDNPDGQLGDATNTNSESTPVSVSNLNSVVQIMSGENHSCALLSSGTVKCWGANWAGQLGDGSNNYSNVPVAVQNLSGATAISSNNATSNSSCAIIHP